MIIISNIVRVILMIYKKWEFISNCYLENMNFYWFFIVYFIYKLKYL